MRAGSTSAAIHWPTRDRDAGPEMPSHASPFAPPRPEKAEAEHRGRHADKIVRQFHRRPHGDVGMGPRQVEMAVGAQKFDPEIGRRMPQPRDDRRQHTQAKRVGRGHAHVAGQGGAGTLQHPADRLHRPVDLPRGVDDALARAGHDIAARGLVEDLESGRRLIGCDTAEHGRVIHPEPARGSTHRALLGHGEDESQVVPVVARHPVSLRGHDFVISGRSVATGLTQTVQNPSRYGACAFFHHYPAEFLIGNEKSHR